jgi:putative nucleotidyltransferase with HDIG domain
VVPGGGAQAHIHQETSVSHEAAPHGALIVDDQPAVRALLARMLEGTGMTCTLAATGAEALAALDIESFDVAFLDIRLEDVNGLELASRVRAQHADTALVMVTGVDDVATIIEAMHLGAVDYLLKPFKPSEVARAVRSALRFTQERRNLSRLPHLELEIQNRARDVMDLTSELASSREGSFDALVTAMQERDGELAAHSARVADIGAQIAGALGLAREDVALVVRAAQLHDVGKWCLPESVLHKAAPLSTEEATLVRKHAQVGFEILRRIPGAGQVAEVVWAHQERYDGTGYPRGLRHQEIPLAARIIAVADTLDAITSDRPYRPRRALDYALAELERCSGSQFDPVVAHAARRVVGIAA